MEDRKPAAVRVRRLPAQNAPPKTSKKPSSKNRKKKRSQFRAEFAPERPSDTLPRSARKEEALYVWEDPSRKLLMGAVRESQTADLIEVLTDPISRRPKKKGPGTDTSGAVSVARIVGMPPGMGGVFVDAGSGPNGYIRSAHLPPTATRDMEPVSLTGPESARLGDMVVVQTVAERPKNSTKGPRMTGRVRVLTRTAEVYLGDPQSQTASRIQPARGLGPLSDAHRKQVMPALASRMSAYILVDPNSEEWDAEIIQHDLKAASNRLTELCTTASSRFTPGLVSRPPGSICDYIMREYGRSLDRVLVYDAPCAEKLRKSLLAYAGMNQQRVAEIEMEVPSKGHTPWRPSVIERQIQESLSTIEQIPGGGWLTIEQTEAFGAVIDVNGGKRVQDEGDEGTLNVAAARTIPRAVRLRGIGGQVVIDFVDVLDGRASPERSATAAEPVVTALKEALAEYGLDAVFDTRAATQMLGPLRQGIAKFDVKRTRLPLSDRYKPIERRRSSAAKAQSQ